MLDISTADKTVTQNNSVPRKSHEITFKGQTQALLVTADPKSLRYCRTPDYSLNQRCSHLTVTYLCFTVTFEHIAACVSAVNGSCSTGTDNSTLSPPTSAVGGFGGAAGLG